jgi:hypothetical protein
MISFKGAAQIGYHVLVIILSAALALSLPFITGSVVRKLTLYWTVIENERILLLSFETFLTLLFVVFFNNIRTGLQEKRLSGTVRGAGLDFLTPASGFFRRLRIKKLKEKKGTGGDIMIIGSTGYRTLVSPEGDLHDAVQNCRELKIMLLDPFGEGARERARIINSHISPGDFRYQILETIYFLKDLRELGGNIRLKLYPDAPRLKLAILGGHICVQHYHTGLDVRKIPEYVFHHGQNPGSLYTYFYQYFLSRWNDANIPEYSFDTDDLIYRDNSGNEIGRGSFLID